MFRFNLEESSWLPEIKDVQWQQPQLDSLSDQPFNILDCIPQQQHQQHQHDPIPVAESVTTASTYEEDMEYEQDDLWTSHTFPTTLNTLSWDTRNSHFPSLPQTQLAHRNIGTPFITEAPTRLFDPIIQSQTITVAESQLVKSLIQAMVGLPSIYFQWRNNQFHMYPVRVLGLGDKTIQPLLKDILKFATKLKRIERVAQTCHLYPHQYGLTGLAFASCLSQWHMNVQHAIVSVFENQQATLLKVYHYVHDLSFITEQLYQLCCIEPEEQMSRIQLDAIERFGFYLPFGAEILNLLYAEIKQYDLAQSGNYALYRDICLSMLCYTSVPYTSILSKWLGLDSSGVLDDPYQEFFVMMRDQVDDLLKRFQIRNEAKLPYFINNTLAVYIFRSGQSLQLLKKTRPNHPLFNLQEPTPLNFLFKNSENEEYMEKLLYQCKTIKAYNIGSPVIAQEMVVQVRHQQAEEVDADIADSVPRLTFLSEINLKGDFMNTLQQLTHHQQEPSQFIPTLDTIIHSSYLKPLDIWCPLLNESLMSFFIHQFKLESHLSLLFDYFLFGSSTFVTDLKDTLFKSRISLEHDTAWPPKFSHLSAAFKHLLLEEEQDLISFSIRNTTRTSPWLNPNAVAALDFLQLNYNASYPLNIVITPNIIEKYNRIFTFSLQVLRTSTITKRMYEPLKNAKWYRTNIRDTICLYRFQLDQFMTAVQGYVHDTAIHSSWFRFMRHVKEMPLTDDYAVIMEPYTFKEYHQHVLDCILYKCFSKKSQSSVLEVLQSVMQDIIIFGAILDDYKMTDINGEEKLLMKCRRIFEQFQKHTKVFVRVLHVMEEKGSGRLSNILNSTTSNIFKDLYARHEAKLDVDVFVKDLLVRLCLNGFLE
ncbi:Spc98 family-domain-containing protein [Thamnidium elegans]|uniref:Spindle pole body component n=1 Tax=Thamnidium elegans TaxID=101142 RepID=A0A8H7SSF7_9FUNG|nr:hypothetical protein INT48_000088 [Thamnidium elegans]KAI8094147.1 Spc98 family-domain-containing protein [Thamnidium elegans]